jgi:hypothetical protein
MSDNFPRFSEALRALPAQDVVDADVLQLSMKSLRRYRKGRFPKVLQFLVQRPALLRALVEDVERNTAEERSAA